MSPAGARPSRTAWLPGLLVALGAAAIAWGIHALLPAVPWLTVALVLGVIAGCVRPARATLDGVLRPGLAIASRRLLRLGIVLLGLKLSLDAIAALGWVVIVAIAVLVVASFFITLGIGRLFRLEGDQPVLLAAGFSICGVSAVGAMSAARGSEKDSATPIALVTLFGTAAIVVLPLLAPLLGLRDAAFGQWVGASVHDVGQVVATAQLAGSVALAAAIVVKLTRVLMLAPLVAIASVAARRSGSRSGAARPPIVPLFIVGFIAAMLVRTFAPVPDVALDIADVAQSILLAAALFAIGASLRLEVIARTALRSVAAAAVSWAIILALALGIVALAAL